MTIDRTMKALLVVLALAAWSYLVVIVAAHPAPEVSEYDLKLVDQRLDRLEAALSNVRSDLSPIKAEADMRWLRPVNEDPKSLKLEIQVLRTEVAGLASELSWLRLQMSAPRR